MRVLLHVASGRALRSVGAGHRAVLTDVPATGTSLGRHEAAANQGDKEVKINWFWTFSMEKKIIGLCRTSYSKRDSKPCHLILTHLDGLGEMAAC